MGVEPGLCGLLLSIPLSRVLGSSVGNEAEADLAPIFYDLYHS